MFQLRATLLCMDKLDDILSKKRERKRLPAPAVRRSLREASGLTQAEFAAVLGVNRAAVSRWETGTRSPRGELAKQYQAALERITAEVAAT